VRLTSRLFRWTSRAVLPFQNRPAAKFVFVRHRTPIQTALSCSPPRASNLELERESCSSSEEQVAIALRETSRQAALLGELVELAGETITRVCWIEVTDRGGEARPCPIAVGGPTRVRSLAEIAGSYKRLIWLGTTTADTSGSCWSVKQLGELAAAGIKPRPAKAVFG